MDAYTRANEIVRIRPFEKSDAENFVAAARESVPVVGKWMDWCRADYSIEQAQAWIDSCQQNSADGTAYEFALVDHSTGEFFGGAGVNQINAAHNFATIGYCVRQSRQRIIYPAAASPKKSARRSNRSRAIGLFLTASHGKARFIR